jgi:L-ribulokinase
LADATMDYSHAVMDHALPDGTPLPPDWALQHPQDYLDCIRFTIPEALRRAGVSANDVIGLGIDFTSNTMLPVDANGNPLCLKPEFASNPYAWPMLWKHHAAQKYATRMEEIAKARGESFLARYGGKVSSEWMFPRLIQLLEEAPEICAAADRFIEAGDWLVNLLTGSTSRSACMGGYKAFHHDREGYPSDDYLAACHPDLPNLVHTQLGQEFDPAGAKAGEINLRGASMIGLKPGTAVAPASIDAHVAFPSIGSAAPGDMVMILGTSACHLVLGDKETTVPGMCGVVKGGMTPDT